jgi:hypothetical protein
MMIRFVLLLAFIAVPCIGAAANDPIPSDEQIEEWWKPKNREHPDERLEV